MSYDPPLLSELLQHRAFLERFARRLARDASVAEDVVQETWLEALERPPSHRSNLRAWLRRVARNAFLQRRRSQNSAPSFEVLDGEPIDEAGEALEHEAIARALGTQLLALPEPYRRVLLLRYYEDRTPTEIARQLERSLNTVTSQLARGLRLLEERLDRSHPGGRSQWLRASLLLVPGAESVELVPPRVLVRRALRRVRASALLTALVATVTLFVGLLVLRASARSPSAERDGVAVASADARPEAQRPTDAREAVEVEPAALEPDLLAAAEPSSAAPVIATLLVQVVSVDGKPVSGARVGTTLDRAARAGGPRLKTCKFQGATDAQGRIEIRLRDESLVHVWMENAGILGVTVEAAGFANSDTYALRFPESGRESVTIALKPCSVALRGTITDEAGVPLENATVDAGRFYRTRIGLGSGRFLVKGPVTQITKADGRFEHEGLAAGTVRLLVEHEGFVSHASTLFLSDPSDSVHDVVLRRGSSVVGRVVTEDGLPAAGARVRVSYSPEGPNRMKQETCADLDGNFELQGISPGRTWLAAEHPAQHGKAAFLLVDFAAKETRTWNPVLGEVPPLRLRIQRADGSPLAGALVTLRATQFNEASQRFLTVGPDGRVRLDAVPDTEMTVNVFLAASDIDNGLPPCHVRAGLLRGPDEQVVTVPEESLTRGGLRGSLLDHEGQPLANAFLQLRVHNDGAYLYPMPVDPETGAFEIERLPAQSYELVAWTADIGTERLDTIEVFAGDVFDLGEIRLSRPVAWSAPWPTPETAAGDAFELVKIDDLGDIAKCWTVASGALPPPGSFTLLPGRYEWRVSRGGEVLRSEDVEAR